MRARWLTEGFDGPPQCIDVEPGGRAVAVVVWRNLTTDAATVARGAYLDIAPAGGEARHTLALNVDPGNTGRLAVSPWRSPPGSEAPPLGPTVL